VPPGPARPGSPDDPEWIDFRARVHRALARLHDPPGLETLALASLARARRGADSGTAGQALRRDVLDAIDALRSTGASAGASHADRAHRLLTARYLHGTPIADVQRDLAVSRSEYFREQGRAVTAIAAVLWERWAGAERPMSPHEPRALEARRHRSNLPAPMSSFVGRGQEIAEVTQLLASARLVTLAGAGGIGKTRLALQVAAALGDDAEEVSFVDLAPVDDPGLVPRAIASALEVVGEPDRAPLDNVVHHVQGRSILLVLDNCEHLVAACARAAETLSRRCPALRLLATSREPLRATGEAVWRVRPLTVPGAPDSEPTTGWLARDGAASGGRCPEPLAFEAVELFVARARTALPSFGVSDRSAAEIVEICRRLDGVPLAIELAAALVGGLGLAQIVARLDDRFRLLTTGRRTAPARHRTLRAVVDWSHDLLGAPERALFRRLSVFAGGWTLEAAEAVCGGGGLDRGAVLETLLALVDRSLVIADVADEDGARYRMLETLRQYGREQLAASGEASELRRRHAAYFLALAEAAGLDEPNADHARWFPRLDAELDNLRTALRAATEQDVKSGLRLAGALWLFWIHRGLFAEGREWLAPLLERARPRPRTRAMAKAILAAAHLAVAQGHAAAARPLAEEAVALAREIGDRARLGWSMHMLAHCLADHEAEHAMLVRSVDELRGTGDDIGLAWSLYCLGNAVALRGDAVGGQALHEKSLERFRRAGSRWGVALGLTGLGNAAASSGDHATAHRLLAQGLALQREVGRRYLSDTLNALGRAAWALGRTGEAEEHFRESLTLARVQGARWEAAISLEGLAAIDLAAGRAHRATRLLAAAAALRSELGTALSPAEQAAFESKVTVARSALDKAAFAAAWTEVRAAPEPAITDALADEPSAEPIADGAPAADARSRRDPLTPREREVATLLANGLGNRAIAARLVISERTAERHVENIRAKLGVTSRTQIGVWMAQHR
jgi:predicted ATPase/DNA-binding CsgD family transcriptional regulator